MLKVYLAVPIIANRDLGKAQTIAGVLAELGCHLVSDWVVRADPGYRLSPTAVFRRDTQGVRDCDVLVAEVSTRSHGVGMEIMLAQVLGKPIIGLHQPAAPVSRLLQGTPNTRLIEYASMDALQLRLQQALTPLISPSHDP
jgi:nucleoside 2-deoxyribosyltransferase